MAKEDDLNGNTEKQDPPPWWARWIGFVGVPSFLLLFLLGAIPWLPSPFFNLQQIHAELRSHRNETKRLINVYRLTCAGVWQNNQAQQEECTRAAHGVMDDNSR